VPDRVIADLELTAWDLRTFCVLARHCRKDRKAGVLIPGTIRARTIAQQLGADSKTGPVLVRRAIRHLAERGHLKAMVRRGATSTYDLNPAWQSENPGVLTSQAASENPGVLTTENPGVLAQGQSENPGVLPVSSDRSFSDSQPENGQRPRRLAVDKTSPGRGDGHGPRVENDSPEVAEARDLAEGLGITQTDFAQAVAQRSDLTGPEVLACVEKLAAKYPEGDGLTDPAAMLATWLRKEDPKERFRLVDAATQSEVRARYNL